MQGYLYQLDDHLDRFYTSAGKAALIPPFARPQLRRIILETAAASQRFDGMFLQGTCHFSVLSTMPFSPFPSVPEKSLVSCIMPLRARIVTQRQTRLGFATAKQLASLAQILRLFDRDIELQDPSGTGLGLDRADSASHHWNVLSPASTAWSTTTGTRQTTQRYVHMPELWPRVPVCLPAAVHQRLCFDVQGWKVKTSPVPIKDPYFATLKSNNYLPNALLALDAQLEGFDQVCLAHSDLCRAVRLT